MGIGIVEYGVVGKVLARLFGYQPDAADVWIYDKFLADLNSAQCNDAIRTSNPVFVSVPTPQAPDSSCDPTAVEAVVSWVRPPMCLKSTFPPGTVERLIAATGRRIRLGRNASDRPGGTPGKVSSPMVL